MYVVSQKIYKQMFFGMGICLCTQHVKALPLQVLGVNAKFCTQVLKMNVCARWALRHVSDAVPQP